MWLSIVIYAPVHPLPRKLLGAFRPGFRGNAPTRRSRRPPFIMAPFFGWSFEYVLTYVLTGFPWGLLGYSQYQGHPVHPDRPPWTGVYGLSFVCVLLQSTFVLAMRRRKKAPFLRGAGPAGGHPRRRGTEPRSTLPPGKDSFTAVGHSGKRLLRNILGQAHRRKKRPGSSKTTWISRGRRARGRRPARSSGRSSRVPLCFSCPEGFYTRAFTKPSTHFARDEDVHASPRDQRDHGRPPVDGRNTTTRPSAFIPDRIVDPLLQDASRSLRRIHALQEGLLFHRQDHQLHRGPHAGTRSSSSTSSRASFRLAHLLRNHFPRPCPPVHVTGRATFLVTITNDGWYGRTRRPPTSISPTPSSGPSKTGVSFSAPPRPASAASSTPTAGSSPVRAR